MTFFVRALADGATLCHHAAPGAMQWAFDVCGWTLAWCTPGYLTLIRPDHSRAWAIGRVVGSA